MPWSVLQSYFQGLEETENAEEPPEATNKKPRAEPPPPPPPPPASTPVMKVKSPGRSASFGGESPRKSSTVSRPANHARSPLSSAKQLPPPQSPPPQSPSTPRVRQTHAGNLASSSPKITHVIHPSSPTPTLGHVLDEYDILVQSPVVDAYKPPGGVRLKRKLGRQTLSI